MSEPALFSPFEIKSKTLRKQSSTIANVPI